jgi:predicted regulator of amino acid metabolism with ACT domain
MWIQTLLYEMGIQVPRVAKLRCDNIELKHLFANPATKHIEIDYHSVQERVAREIVLCR